MKNLYSILIFISITACKYNTLQESRTSGSKPSKSASYGELESIYCLDLTQNKDIADLSALHYTSILNYTLSENCLCIKYQYPGCAKGKAILTYKHPEEINGPQRQEIFFKLFVKDAGDCESLISDSTCFSMKRMQLVGSEVLIRINDENNIAIVKTQN